MMRKDSWGEFANAKSSRSSFSRPIIALGEKSRGAGARGEWGQSTVDAGSGYHLCFSLSLGTRDSAGTKKWPNSTVATRNGGLREIPECDSNSPSARSLNIEPFFAGCKGATSRRPFRCEKGSTYSQGDANRSTLTRRGSAQSFSAPSPSPSSRGLVLPGGWANRRT
jgi:hypothetical protein